MALPAPDLDDRRFQDLVDDAKRLVQQRCPEWTDHNVSDPGVTLIEVFAWMTEQVVYRLNRVPDRLHTTFLDLLGVTTFPPTAARGPQTFWLSAPQPAAVVVPGGTQVATARPPGGEPVVFTTVEDLLLPAVELLHMRTVDAEGAGSRRPRRARPRATRCRCFTLAPQEGDALLLGLSEPAGGCAVALTLDCSVRGRGRRPRGPAPDLGGLDGHRLGAVRARAGRHRGLQQARRRRAARAGRAPPSPSGAPVRRGCVCGWSRPAPSSPRTPRARSCVRRRRRSSAAPWRRCTPTVSLGEVLGTSEGVAGQRFRLQRTPVVPGEIRSSSRSPSPRQEGGGARRDAWQPWQVVPDFGDPGPRTGTSCWTRAPARWSSVLPCASRTAGCASSGACPRTAPSSACGSTAPVAGAGQRRRRHPRGAGAAPCPTSARWSTVAPPPGAGTPRASRRPRRAGPVVLRHRGRAVTAEDFEHLARAAAPEVARVRAVSAGEGADAGGVRVLVVPAVPGRRGWGSVSWCPTRDAAAHRGRPWTRCAARAPGSWSSLPPTRGSRLWLGSVLPGVDGRGRGAGARRSRTVVLPGLRGPGGRRAGRSGGRCTSVRSTGCCRRPRGRPRRGGPAVRRGPCQRRRGEAAQRIELTPTRWCSASTTRSGCSRVRRVRGTVPGLPTRTHGQRSCRRSTRRTRSPSASGRARRGARSGAGGARLPGRLRRPAHRAVGPAALGRRVAGRGRRPRLAGRQAARRGPGGRTGVRRPRHRSRAVRVAAARARPARGGARERRRRGLASPGRRAAGDPEPCVRVRLKGATPQQVEAARPLVRAWCPAHVPLPLEVVT